MNQTQKELTFLVASALALDGKVRESTDPALYTPELIKEAIDQTVYTLLGPVETDQNFYKLMTKNYNNELDHQEVHTLMSSAHIPYVILKGQASARYYPVPARRTMGDVDILVGEEDIEKATRCILSAGFTQKGTDSVLHRDFHRHPKSHWELHRKIHGVNDRIMNYCRDIIERAEVINGMRMPCDFHHGLVILCHFASHLTQEGMGLRHLCDWAVFVRKCRVDRWDKELKDCGLWQLAKQLSLLSEKYLGLPHQAWFGEMDQELTDALMEDILIGGNFGEKDEDRSRQIKYIANRGEKTVDEKPVLIQLWQTIGNKAKIEKKNRLQVMTDYAKMLRSGERKPDKAGTLSKAAQRKKLYARLRLFEKEE